MPSRDDLDRLLVTMDVAVQKFAVCEVRRGRRLVGAKVDAIMIHYVLAGTMHMTIKGQPTIVCGPGCVAIIPPGMEPSMTADGEDSLDVIGAEHCSIRGDGLLVFDAACGKAGDLRIVAGIVVASVSRSFGIFEKLRAPICEDMADCAFVRQAYAMMLDEIERPELGGGAMTGALMKACLVMVIRRFLTRPEADMLIAGALGDPRLASAIAAVLNQPSAPHNVRSLAAAAGMSRAAFARKFNESFAMGPMEFVAKTRLRHAAELLRSSRLPVKVVAASIGFASRSHFSRAFRDAYGQDPTAFRTTEGRIALDAPAPLRGSRARYALPEEPD